MRPDLGTTSVLSAKKLFRDSTVFATVDLVGKLLAFAVVAVLTRRESAYTFGVIVAGISAASMVQCVVDGGLEVALARALARKDADTDALTGSKITISVGASLPCAAVLVMPRSVAAVPLASLACATTGALLLVQAFLAAHRLAYASIALIGPNVLLIGLVLVLPALNAAEVLFLFAACNGVCALATLHTVEVRPRWMSPVRAARLYRRHLANGIYALVTTVYGRLDTVLLALFGAAAVAGIYGTYFRIVLVGVGLIKWITPLALPALADPNHMRASLMWLEQRLAGVAVAASVLCMVLGPWVLRVVTHGGVLPVATFLLLGLLPVPTVMSGPLVSGMVMSFRSQRLAWMSTCLLGVACCLYVGLIPPLGSTGAALGSLAVETFALAWVWREVFGNRAIPQQADKAHVTGQAQHDKDTVETGMVEPDAIR